MTAIKALAKRLEIQKNCTVKECNLCMLGAPPKKDCPYRLEIMLNEEEIKEDQSD